MPQPRFVESLSSLTDPAALQANFGPFINLKIERIDTGGYSGALFSSISLMRQDNTKGRFILKEVRLQDDWFSVRTADHRGREAQILLSEEAEAIHNIFHTPYRLIAMEAGKIGLLMDDLSAGLFPDEKKPLSLSDQDLMLNKLAEMHATFWQSKALSDKIWLHNPEDFVYLMGPLDHQSSEGSSARNIQQAIKSGWEATLPLLSEPLRQAMLLPPEQISTHWQELPKTLLHGDTKVANFAKAKDGALSLFDWAFAGYAPCTFDIGWFLAVNASRLAEPKEAVLLKYRTLVEAHLGYQLENVLWQRLEEAGIVCGAFMLLWSKGNAMAQGREGADNEWHWWIKRLEQWSNSLQA